MKAQYEKLLKDAKAALDEAGTKIGEGKIDEAKALQEKAKGLREQALVVKAQLDALSALESDEKDAKIAELEAAGKKPVRPMVVDDGDTPKDDDTKAFAPVYVTRYGELKPAVEQVLKDLYGVGYYAKRETQRNAFVKHLKDLGHDTQVLEGGDAQKNLNLLFKALVTSESGDLQDKAPEVFALLQTLKDKSILDQVPPLMRIFVEIQAHPEKEALINALKTPQDLKFDAILSDKLPDMGKVLLLDEALRLHKPELLKDQPALKELYEKLELHPARELLVNALKNIPVNEHEIETRILERSEAVALKAYETVLDAGMNEP